MMPMYVGYVFLSVGDSEMALSTFRRAKLGHSVFGCW